MNKTETPILSVLNCIYLNIRSINKGFEREFRITYSFFFVYNVFFNFIIITI